VSRPLLLVAACTCTMTVCFGGGACVARPVAELGPDLAMQATDEATATSTRTERREVLLLNPPEDRALHLVDVAVRDESPRGAMREIMLAASLPVTQARLMWLPDRGRVRPVNAKSKPLVELVLDVLAQAAREEAVAPPAYLYRPGPIAYDKGAAICLNNVALRPPHDAGHDMHADGDFWTETDLWMYGARLRVVKALADGKTLRGSARVVAHDWAQSVALFGMTRVGFKLHVTGLPAERPHIGVLELGVEALVPVRLLRVGIKGLPMGQNMTHTIGLEPGLDFVIGTDKVSSGCRYEVVRRQGVVDREEQVVFIRACDSQSGARLFDSVAYHDFRATVAGPLPDKIDLELRVPLESKSRSWRFVFSDLDEGDSKGEGDH